MSTTNNKGGVRLVRVDSDRQGQRLDNFLSANLKGVPRSAIYRMIRTGQVRINGSRSKASTRLDEGDEVRIPPARTAESESVTVSESVRNQVRAAVLFEDRNIMVVNKPSGMAVHAGSGLSWGLIDAMRQSRPDEYVELVHRLDRETSGCLLLARNGRALKHFSEQFRDGRVRKLYLCLMNGRMPQARIDVDAPLGKVQAGQRKRVEALEDGKPALTRFRCLQLFSDCTYAEAELFTGRTHQIRAHAKLIGMPLAGDELYAGKAAQKAWKQRHLKRIFLHAHRLGITAPGGETLEFDAPLPPELKNVLNVLE